MENRACERLTTKLSSRLELGAIQFFEAITMNRSPGRTPQVLRPVPIHRRVPGDLSDAEVAR
jgi:hypothetical protein